MAFWDTSRRGSIGVRRSAAVVPGGLSSKNVGRLHMESPERCGGANLERSGNPGDGKLGEADDPAQLCHVKTVAHQVGQPVILAGLRERVFGRLEGQPLWGGYLPQ